MDGGSFDGGSDDGDSEDGGDVDDPEDGGSGQPGGRSAGGETHGGDVRGPSPVGALGVLTVMDGVSLAGGRVGRSWCGLSPGRRANQWWSCRGS